MDELGNAPILPQQDTATIVVAPTEPPKKPTHKSNNPFKKIIVSVGMLALLIVVPMTAFYLSTRSQITDQRNKASGGDNVCTAWSGPISISGLPGGSEPDATYQAQSDIIINNGTTLMQAIWISDKGWTRTVPISNGAPVWSQASSFNGPIAVTTLPGNGSMQAQSDLYIENGAKLMQAIWRGDQGWTRTIPVVNGTPNWGAASSWAGPIAATALPGQGSVQAQTDRYDSNGTVLKQAMWRGDQGWTRSVPVVNGTPNWGAAGAWSGPIGITGLPGNGSYQAQTDRIDGNGTKLVQAIWRGNQGWTRSVPIIAGVPVFTGCPAGTATPFPPPATGTPLPPPASPTTGTGGGQSVCSGWSGPIDIASLPGKGSVQAQTDRYDSNGTVLKQAIWRGDQGWTRTVPVVNGTPNWGAAGAWSGPIEISGLPGTGSYQAQSDIYIENGATLLQAIWRGNQGWTRRVPVANGVPNFGAAAAFQGPIEITGLPGAGAYQAQTDRYDNNGTVLKQAIWRGNQGWTRTVPVVNGTPNFSAASAFSGPIEIDGIPGVGEYQAQSDIVINNGQTLLQAVWRGNQGWTRTVGIINGAPSFVGCPAKPPVQTPTNSPTNTPTPTDIPVVTPTNTPTATPEDAEAPTCTSWTSMYLHICKPVSEWTMSPRSVNCKTTSNSVTAHLDSRNARTMAFYEVPSSEISGDCASVADAKFGTAVSYNETHQVTLSAGTGEKKVCVRFTNTKGSAKCGAMIEITSTSTCTDANCKEKFGPNYVCSGNETTMGCDSPLKTVPEDINGDGKVNALDYQILLANYLKDPIPNIMADINQDDAVNSLDYTRLLAKYGYGQWEIITL